MVIHGQVRNGVIVFDDPTTLPEGATVRVEVVSTTASGESSESTRRRHGGFWKGQVVIAPDFDELPDAIAEAFGMTKPTA